MFSSDFNNLVCFLNHKNTKIINTTCIVHYEKKMVDPQDILHPKGSKMCTGLQEKEHFEVSISSKFILEIF